MNKIANVAKNTSYFTFALILQKIISFSYFIIIARVLGPEDLGKYYFAISFTTIFSILIDIGQTNVLTREIARENGAQEDKNKINNLVSGVVGIKFLLAVLVSLAVISLINLMDYPEITRHLVYLSMFCMVLDTFTASFFAVARGYHNLFWESISSVIFQIIVLTSGLVILKLNLGLHWLMLSLVFASFFNFLYSYILIRKKWQIKIKLLFNRKIMRYILLLTAPFALYAIFQRGYTYFDSVLLSILAGDREVGIYQVPFKIIFALQFLPMAFTASLYPAMSSYWMNNKAQLAVSFERAMNYLMIISIPITAGTIVLADKIILLFKSGYSEAITPMIITISALVFMFVNFAIGALLNACDKQKVNTINMVIVAMISVFLNLLLIPKMQSVGASITVLVTNFLMFALGIYWVPKIISLRSKKIFLVFLKSLFAAVVMAFAVFYLKPFINIVFLVILGGIIYFLLVYILGGFKKEDILSVYKSFKKQTV
ncbi:MAG: flippase [Patescibacteria group bacterium]|nr:flippase [Patescibacteria group bacterium]MDD4611009.1 flippase [Patescibacteria group bacterium]